MDNNYQNIDVKKYNLSSELWVTEKNLPLYNREVLKNVTKYFIPSKMNVLEFGAGIGVIACLFRDKYHISPDCIEIDPELAKILQDRKFSVYESVDVLQEKYDYIYTSNVLEHIEDDGLALDELYSVTSPGGYLAILVPAFMCLYSDLDLHAGHYRRYSKSELIEKIQGSNFKIIEVHYFDSIGFFASYFARFLGYSKGVNLGKDSNLKFYDDYLLPLSKFFDRLGANKIFGKNLVVVAQKK